MFLDITRINIQIKIYRIFQRLMYYNLLILIIIEKGNRAQFEKDIGKVINLIDA